MLKKLIISASIFTSVCLATDSFTNYDLAVKLFNEKKYKEAYEIFIKLSQNDLSNEKVNFYIGRILYELQEYDLAISYFERILFIQPTNTRSQLEIAQSYLMLKNYVQALNDFEELLKNKDLPENVSKNIQSRINYINSTMQKHFFSGVLMMNVMYDTNTNNGTEGTIYYSGLPTTGTAPEKDYSAQLISVLNHAYKYNEQFSINNSFVFFTVEKINTQLV